MIHKKYGYTLRGLAALATVLASSAAIAVPISLTPAGTVGGTSVFRGDLTGLGATAVNSITVIDDGTPIGGAPGIFSGFDLDAIFLDADGNLGTAGDRTFASSFSFTAGSTRATANPAYQPNAAHPGPTFGSLDATTIDLATATLNVFDGVSIADVDLANGFLTLGDGGTLVANFVPGVPVSGFLYLLVGEVGGQPGEGLDAEVLLNEVPEPGTLALLGMGLLGLGVARRRRKV